MFNDGGVADKFLEPALYLILLKASIANGWQVQGYESF